MALKINDRVLEITTSVGTSDIELNNVTPSGYVTFSSGVGNASGTYYAIIHQTQPEWEIGYGVYASGHPLYPTIGDAPTLSRVSIVSSSNTTGSSGTVGSYSKVDFTAGTKSVYCTAPAAKMVLLDQNGNLQIGDTLDSAYKAIFEGDIRASGIHAGSGIWIDQDLAPSSGNVVNRLYNVAGTLYWGNSVVSSDSGDADAIFKISAPSGLGHLGIKVGSGIAFADGENVSTSLSDGGNGSGVITISVPGAIGTDFTLTASGVGSNVQITTGSGLGIVPGDNNIKVELIEDRGSGIFKISGNAYTAGTGLVLQTPSGSNSSLEFNALPATVEQSGIVLLTNTIDSNSGSGTAATPYAVQRILATGVLTTLNFGATAGIAPIQLTSGSGMLFTGGDNVTATLSRDNDNGSGVVTISSTSYTAGSGLFLKPDSGAGAQFNIDVASLTNLGAGDAGPDNTDTIIVYDTSAMTLRNVSVSGLAANSSFAGGYKFTTVVGDDSDTGYTWGAADITAGVGSDTLKFVAGTGVAIDTDSSNNAVRISTSGVGLGAGDGLAPVHLDLGSGISIMGGTNITTVLSKSNGSGVVTINSSVGSMSNFNVGVSGDRTTIENGSGIMFVAGDNVAISLGRTDANSGSGVFTISSTGVGTRLMLGANDLAPIQLGDGDGINFAAGDHISVTVSDNGLGSGVVTIATTGVGTRLMLGASHGIDNIQLGEGSGIRVVGGDGILSTLSKDTLESGIITIAHEDTSSQASVNNSGQVFIQDITLDSFGHVTALTSATSAGAGAGGQAASGADGQFQYNNGGFFAGASGLYYDDTNNRVGVGTQSPFTGLHIVGTGTAYTNIDANEPASRPPIPLGLGYMNPVVMIQQTVDQNGDTIGDGGNGAFICPQANGIVFSTLQADDKISLAASGITLVGGDGSSGRVGILNASPKSTLDVTGSFGLAVSGATEPATLTDKHSVILVDLTDRAASGVINLPASSSDTLGRIYTIKKLDSLPSGVRIVPDGSQLVEGKSEEILFCKDDSITLISATGAGGYGWHAINKNYKPHVTALQVGLTPYSGPAGDNKVNRFYSWYKTWTDMPFDNVISASVSGSAEFNELREYVRHRDVVGAVQDDDGDDIADHYTTRFYPSGVGSGVRILRDGTYSASTRASFSQQMNNGDDRGYIRILHHRMQADTTPSGVANRTEEVARAFGTGRSRVAQTCNVEGVFEAKAGDFVTSQVWHSQGHKHGQPAWMMTSYGSRNTLTVTELFVE